MDKVKIFPVMGGKHALIETAVNLLLLNKQSLNNWEKGQASTGFALKLRTTFSIKSFSIGHYWRNWESLFVTRKGKKFAAEKGSLYQAEEAVRMIPQALVICQIPWKESVASQDQLNSFSVWLDLFIENKNFMNNHLKRWGGFWIGRISMDGAA